MTKLNKLSLALALVAGLASVAPAQAFSLGGYSGGVKFIITGVDEGALYTADCATEVACDSTSLVSPMSSGAAAGEDSWGIFEVVSILPSTAGPALWQAGDNGEHIFGLFGGMVDIYADVSIPGAKQETWSTDGYINMFISTDPNKLYDAAILGPSAAARAAMAGDDFLKGNFAGTADAGQVWYNYPVAAPIATSYSNFNALTKSIASVGHIDIYDGLFMDYLVENTIPDAIGNLQDAGYALLWDSAIDPDLAAAGWTVPLTGSVNTSVIPEPASLALLGLGLIGLASIRRRA